MLAMPAFKIYRIKDSHYQQFRWAPHTAGAAQVKLRDYVLAGQVEAPSVYAAWSELRDQGDALRVGDLLESVDGGLRICKYVGFEEAHWFVPETKPSSEGASPGTVPMLEAAGENTPTP